jgi:3-oxoacyl-[acyl-carrier protein] reductase
MGRLTGKTALITGCNRGIGRGILEAFVKEGASVIACTRSMDEALTERYQQLSTQYGVRIYPVCMDLSDPESIKLGMKAVTELKVPIDILVNNAGIAKFRPFVMSKVDDFKEMMQVNLYAPVQISQYVVKHMLKQRKGSIINFCSVSGLDSNSGNAAYGASKAAIASLTRTMAKELAKVNIRVNAVAPGFVATDMNKQIDADYMESMLPQIALERVADVSEVANTVLFLASDESSYLTGQVIRIDGGM